MAGQWEVVCKKKEKPGRDSNQKIGQQMNKKTIENLNLKDVLAKSQVKNLYSNGKNKENKPLEMKKAPELGSKKIQKKLEKMHEVPKPKAPKSVESALNQVDIKEFQNIFEESKLHFPEAPIIWLKELAKFLNQKMNVELQDPIFTTKPQCFPLISVPSGVKSVLDNTIQGIDMKNVQLFFDIALTSMATDMSKNLPALGYKLLLQYIALDKPILVIQNLSKHCILRTSYQNRPNIGLSILWAVGQAGIHNFQAGLTIFQEFMLPLIELKNYSKYIIKYLISLIVDAKEAFLTKEQFIFILDIIFTNRKNFPNELKQDLLAVIPNLKLFLFSSNKKDTFNTTVDFCLKKLPVVCDLYQQCLCDMIVECCNRDQNALEHWCKIYEKNIASSAILLKYLDQNFPTIGTKLNRKAFTEVAKQIIITSNELSLKKKKEEGILEAIFTAERLVGKMSDKKKSRSSFKFLFFTSCLMVVASVYYYDIKQQGNWQKSNTYRFLKNSGVCEFTHQFLHRVRQGLSVIDAEIDEKFPSYRRSVIEFSEPYIELAGNFGRILHNMYNDVKEVLIEKYPVVIESIEHYAPGVLDHSQNTVSSVWSSSIYYFNRSVDYLKNEVFVGQLSPENMQRVVLEALNTTQYKATEYYHWLYEKVQSKID